MLALVTLLLASAPVGLAAGTAAAPACAAGDTCDPWAFDEPPAPTPLPDYATPAVIDCRATVVAKALESLVGDCDASFLVSRVPEPESPPAGTLTAARRGRGVRSSSVSNVPVDPAGAIHSFSGQPFALFALPELPAPCALPIEPGSMRLPPSVCGHRLERPPRA